MYVCMHNGCFAVHFHAQRTERSLRSQPRMWRTKLIPPTTIVVELILFPLMMSATTYHTFSSTLL
jgi:hypothetical protein